MNATRCIGCGTDNPAPARYCMQCGQALARDEPGQNGQTRENENAARAGPDYRVFGLTLAASLALSFVLMYVFRLPIFILAGFLPLLWRRRRSR